MWGDKIVAGEGYSSGQRKRWQHEQNRKDNPEAWQKQTEQGQFCGTCGAWLGSLGLEPTPQLYVDHIVQISREIRRVLRPDGIFWLNIADSYAGSSCGSHDYRPDGASLSKNDDKYRGQKPGLPPGLKPKDLVGIPWRVALALQADGWYLRSDIIWAKGVSGQKEFTRQVYEAALKHTNEETAQAIVRDLDLYVGNCMPESVNGWRWERHRVKVDGEWKHCPGCEKCLPNNKLVLRKGSWRPTKSHEYVFMFSKSDRYYADANAIREPFECANPNSASYRAHGKSDSRTKDKIDGKPAFGSEGFWKPSESGRNIRSVWTVPTQPFKGLHFAVYPEKLIEPMILASCPERVCRNCGEPEVAVIEDTVIDMGKESQDKTADCVGTSQTSALRYKNKTVERKVVGYRPLCKCNAGFEPGTVLDIFAGSGTTLVVAKRLGRRYIGIELNPDYVHMAEERVRSVEPSHPTVRTAQNPLL
jgi:DNA modification methylase